MDHKTMRDRTNLLALVNETTNMTAAGRVARGRCPFCKEDTLRVSDKGFYLCDACEANGSAIDWVMQRDGVPFAAAVATLAKRLDP